MLARGATAGGAGGAGAGGADASATRTCSVLPLTAAAHVQRAPVPCCSTRAPAVAAAPPGTPAQHPRPAGCNAGGRRHHQRDHPGGRDAGGGGALPGAQPAPNHHHPVRAAAAVGPQGQGLHDCCRGAPLLAATPAAPPGRRLHVHCGSWRGRRGALGNGSGDSGSSGSGSCGSPLLPRDNGQSCVRVGAGGTCGRWRTRSR